MINKAIERVNSISIKKQLVGIGLIILMTDLFILFDVAILRQVFALLCFTIIPGFLIVSILKLDRLGFVGKFVLSVGLSVVFLMFAGLFINEVYFLVGYSTPLSPLSLMISFSVILFLLIFFSYKRNKEKERFSIPRLNLENYGRVLVFIPLSFPVLSIFGTRLMNTAENNIIVLFLISLIVVYVLLLAFLNKNVPRGAYPIAILMITISLLFLVSLRSNHIMGGDVHSEYMIFQLTYEHLHWDIAYSRHIYNSCLSVTLLPAVYQSLLNIDGEYVYKGIFMIIIAATSTVLYELFRRYIGEQYAFLASFFFISQFAFIYTVSLVRASIAVFFFSLLWMVFFSNKIDGMKKRILFIIFMFSVIVSHYSVAYGLLGMMSLAGIIMVLYNVKSKKKSAITITITILLFIGIFLWYAQLTERPFTNFMEFSRGTFDTLGKIFVEESRHPTLQKAMGMGLHGPPEIINFVIYYLSFLFIGIGIIILLKRYRDYGFEKEYFLFILISAGFLVVMVLVPHLSQGYGIERIYQQVLVLLCAPFVIGLSFIFRNETMRIRSILITMIIIVVLFSNMGVVYQIFGVHHSLIFNSDGFQYGSIYVHDEEAVAGEWLRENKPLNWWALTDTYRSERLKGMGTQWTVGTFFTHNRTELGYIFLGYQNVVDKEIVPVRFTKEFANNISEYSHLFVNRNKIYANGGAEIYRHIDMPE